jgi:ketosteroid isomerase-like protein
MSLPAAATLDRRTFLGAAGLGLVSAAAGIAAPSGGAGEAELIAAETLWMDAMKARDRKALEAIMAPEFTLGGLGEPERTPLARSVWIDNALNRLRVESVRFERSRASAFGDAGTVHAVFTWRGRYDGEAFTDTVTLVDTWLKRGGRWRVVSRLVEAFHPPG